MRFSSMYKKLNIELKISLKRKLFAYRSFISEFFQNFKEEIKPNIYRNQKSGLIPILTC